MAQARAPGIYHEPNEQRVYPLELGRTGVPVFLGFTRRGPLDRPVKVTSEAQFVEVFGEPMSEGYLLPALRGFFDNGGDQCFVLRVARAQGDAEDDVARRATMSVPDRAGAPALVIEAQDEGAWGNGLRVTLTGTQADGRTFLTRDADEGDETLQVKSSHGFSSGMLVCVHDEARDFWTWVTRTEGKLLTLAEPLPADFRSGAPTYVVPHTFSLTVRDYEREERFERLSMHGASPRFVERLVTDQSRLVRVRALRPATPAALALPMDHTDARLEGGADGTSNPGPEDFIGYDRGPSERRGLHGLVEHPEIDVIALPDLMAAYERGRAQDTPRRRFRTLRDVEVVQDAVITYCERTRSAFAVLDLPPGADHEEALRWRQQFDSAHAAFYFPWVVTLIGARPVAVPPCGHVAGIISRLDREVGIHKAPANEVVDGVVDLSLLLQDDHLAELNSAGVNCIRPFAARGIRIWGARTASSDPEWRFVNVRRTVSSISAAIERGTQWAVFEPNGPALWKRVTRSIVGFLVGLREKGMLSGSTPEEAFFVQCDDETNAPDDVDRGMMTTRIGLAVTRPVEFIVFRVTQRLEDQAQQDEE